MDEHMKRRLDKQKKLFRQLGIQLDALSIHEKNFSNKLRGYDQEEVDSFLDEVIQDYERFYATISDLMDKWQEQQIIIRDLRAGVKPEAERPALNPEEIEETVAKLEADLRLLKKQIRPEQRFYID
ncbi:DivIVA domain-containing protein [Paenibacillus glucanolyticus]|jgi:DivIVA domain-containing protein|uniref:Cell division protein n=1 Tax=Paenibacillus glucanolyticus TaxID=59843 RepID=A0A163E5B5_9BACL|nr:MULTISPECIES: DivIVA domain-containing protein [Paenibacillus]ANA83042.1 cell division protein [Paenibacillus glucanolyticus]AVV57869.1 DivIVA domain-containing protein [Paenibacillus glucanolyticus]AWP27030.1 DivIVA domain-containing protein [Paenibacillus sp. Cedars]ETT34657.1 DivIVA domain-containing protein [Paenibacillus sp. FSL R5-808]KZS43618.1 cell division protein [Paenibacillus glucanolyticus]